MNVLSLFDGMSCGQIALNRIGIQYDNYFASEIDKSAIKVTQHNFPNTIQLGDVKNINISDLPKIDLMIGGSPCQSFSFAGNKVGMITKDNIEIKTLDEYLKFRDEGFDFIGQSYLFWEYVRILREVKPKYFLLENVRMNKKWEEIITTILGHSPIKINSNLVSAQNRPRLYWTNIPNVDQPKDKGLTYRDVFDCNRSSYVFWPRWRLEKFINREYAKFNTIYRIEEFDKKVQCLCAQFGANHPKTWDEQEQNLRSLTPIEFERLQTVPDNYTNIVPRTARHRMLGNGWTVDVIAHILKNIKG